MAKRRYSKKSYGKKSYSKKRGRASSGGRTVKLVVQVAPSQGLAVNPMTIPGTTLVSAAKPGRAKF